MIVNSSIKFGFLPRIKPIIALTISILFVTCGTIPNLSVKDKGRVKKYKCLDYDDVIFLTRDTQKKAVYEIKKVIDLRGQTITIPEGGVLAFRGGSFKNGRIVGVKTKIENKRRMVLENVVLEGSFVGEAYLSWFKSAEDETFNFSSLLLFDTCHIDRDITLRGDRVFVNNKDIIIYGHGSIIKLKSINSEEFLSFNNVSITINDLTIDCDRNLFNGTVSLVKISTTQNVLVDGLSIKNYGSYDGKLQSSFLGLTIKSVKDNSVVVQNCSFSNCIVTGDGIEIAGHGCNYPLNIYSFGSDDFGIVRINTCDFKNIVTVDNKGNCIVDDGSAIYIQGIKKKGDIKISNCKFDNVSKRAMKLQCNYPIIENCTVNNSELIPIDAVVGIQGGGAIIRNLKAVSNGIIIQCNHGDDLFVYNSSLHSFNFNCISFTGNNMLVNNCELEGESVFHGVKETGSRYYGVNREGTLTFESSYLLCHSNSPVSTSIEEMNKICIKKCKLENVYISLPCQLQLNDSEFVYTKDSPLSYFISGYGIDAKNIIIRRNVNSNKYAFYLAHTSDSCSSLRLEGLRFMSDEIASWNIVQIQGGAKLSAFEANKISVEVPSNTNTIFLYGSLRAVDFNNIRGHISDYKSTGNAKLVYSSNLINGIIELDNIECPLFISNTTDVLPINCVKFVLSKVDDCFTVSIPEVVKKRVMYNSIHQDAIE